MDRFELILFPNEVDLGEAVAAAWLREIEAVDSRPYLAALSGGRIAHRFFSAMAAAAKSRRNAMNSVQFFWSDERCVPPTDPESNFAAARDLLLSPLGIAETQIHRLRGEDRPESAAAAAER